MFINEYIFWNIIILISLLVTIRTKNTAILITFVAAGLLTTTFLTETSLTQNITWKNNDINDLETTETLDEVSVDWGDHYGGGLTELTTRDNSYLIVNESTFTPGICVALRYKNVEGIPTHFEINMAYDGGQTHDIHIEGYDTCVGNNGFLSDPWKQITLKLDDSGSFFTYNISIPNGDCFVSESKEVIIRIDHEVAGTATHDLFIDDVTLTVLRQDKNIEARTGFIIFNTGIGLIFLFLLIQKSGIESQLKKTFGGK